MSRGCPRTGRAVESVVGEAGERCRTQDLLPGVELGFQLGGICLGHFGPPLSVIRAWVLLEFAAKGRFAVREGYRWGR